MEKESQNYLGKVRVTFLDENDKLKKQVFQHLVEAVSVTDAEAKLVVEYKGDTRNWNVISVTESPIENFIK